MVKWFYVAKLIKMVKSGEKCRKVVKSGEKW